MRPTLRVFVSVAMATTIMVLAGCARPDPNSPPPPQLVTPSQTPTIATGPRVGWLAPDFKYTDAQGKATSLSDFRGKTVVLNFWATWCGPCRDEMPLLQALFDDKERAAQGLVLLSVNDGEPPATVQQFMTAFGYSFPVVLDMEEVLAAAYYIRALPTTFFIGPDGVIRNIRMGAFSGKADLERVLSLVMR